MRLQTAPEHGAGVACRARVNKGLKTESCMGAPWERHAVGLDFPTDDELSGKSTR